MVKLVKKQVVITGSFAELLKIAKNGDHIDLCSSPFTSGLQSHWCVHPEGIVVQKGNTLLLNGKQTLFQGTFQDWRVAVDDPSKIFLLNKKEEFGPEYSIISDSKGNEICRIESWWLQSWQAHLGGVVVSRGHHNQSNYSIELNAKEVLTNINSYGPCRWSIIPGTTDVLIQESNFTFRRNEKLQEFDFKLGRIKDWEVCNKGLVFNQDDGEFSIIRWGEKKPVIYFDSHSHLDGCTEWRLHPNGIVVEETDSSKKNYTLIVVKG